MNKRIAKLEAEVERLRDELGTLRTDRAEHMTKIMRLRELIVELVEALDNALMFGANRDLVDRAKAESDDLQEVLLKKFPQYVGRRMSPFEEYCPQCLGPCMRRPRHGEMNI